MPERALIGPGAGRASWPGGSAEEAALAKPLMVPESWIEPTAEAPMQPANARAPVQSKSAAETESGTVDEAPPMMD